MNKSTFQNVSIKQIAESKTNPRGTSFEGPEFNDLVASIKEKGIIVPLILRPAGKGYEVVAGSRRFRAAQKLQLTEVPANIQSLSDTEAREVQIIENLQRADVHPLDEGKAYRELMEKGAQEVESIAIKTGKSTAYVRGRLALTDLTSKAASAFRAGKISAGHAALIARLETADQEKALKRVIDYEDDIAQLREWIRELTFRKLSSAPPWKDHAATVAAMAPCPECSKRTGTTLFNEKEAGQCPDPKCFARKLAAHVALVKNEFAAKKTPLTLVAGGYVSPLPAGVVRYDEYRKLTGKEKCPSEHSALIVAGDLDDGLGETIRICTDKGCKVHGARAASVYKATPKEIAARKAAVAREEAKLKREAKLIEDAAKKVKLPINSKAINALVEIMIREIREDGIRSVVKGRGWPVLRVKVSYQNKPAISYQATLRAKAKEMTDEQRLQLVFEGFISSGWDGKKIIKML